LDLLGTPLSMDVFRETNFGNGWCW
jgi:hypothetical protein